jgi:hypothetical protein
VIQLTIEDAIARRDDGISRAGDHAGDRWKRAARGYLLEFLVGRRSPFLAEDVRQFAEGHSLESPLGWAGVGCRLPKRSTGAADRKGRLRAG